MVLCLAVTLLAGVASGLGVFARGDGSKAAAVSIRGEHYEYATTGIYEYNAERVVAEGVGWDLVTLFLVVPGMLLTLPFVARGSLRGRLVAAGLLGYFFYQYLMYALMWAFGPLFVVFVAIYSAVSRASSGSPRPCSSTSWRTSSPALPRAGRRGLHLPHGRHARAHVGGRGSRRRYRGDLTALYGMPTLVVQALDLGVIVPLGVFVGVASWLRKPVAYLLAPVFVVKGFGLSAGIAAMVALGRDRRGHARVVALVCSPSGAAVAVVHAAACERARGAVRLCGGRSRCSRGAALVGLLASVRGGRSRRTGSRGSAEGAPSRSTPPPSAACTSCYWRALIMEVMTRVRYRPADEP